MGEASESSLTPSMTPSHTPPLAPVPARAPQGVDEPRRRLSRVDAAGAPFHPWPEPGEVGAQAILEAPVDEVGDENDPFHDPDDDESTSDHTAMSMSTTPGAPAPQHAGGGSRRVIIGALALAVMIVAIAGAVRLFRQVSSGDLRGAPAVVQTAPATGAQAMEETKDGAGDSAEGTSGADAMGAAGASVEKTAEAAAPRGGEAGEAGEARDVAEAATTGAAVATEAAVERSGPVPVIFRAPKGTRITVGKRNFVPNRSYRIEPGKKRVFYACPRGFRGRGSWAHAFKEVPGGTQQVSIACRRK